MLPITPEQLLAAYRNGYFPMALSAYDPELYWFSPEERGVIPLERFNVPRGLKRAMKTHPYRLTVDRDFEGVIRGCAERNERRDGTWINEEIVQLYTALHRMGCAHSVEVWREEDSGFGIQDSGETRLLTLLPQNPESLPLNPESQILNPSLLIGGLYGVSIGGAFFGESMFSRAPDASKIALVTLVEILREAEYALLDTQYVNEHLKQFGVEAVAKADYIVRLESALNASPNPSTRFSTVSVRKGLASASSESLT